MMEYEIKCEKTSGWYQGIVDNFDPQTKKFHVTYPNNWKPACWEVGEHIRPLPDPVDPVDIDKWTPEIDEAVECQGKGNANDEYSGWFAAKIRAFHGENFYISFDDWPDNHEHSPKSWLRPKNKKRTLSATNMEQKIIEVSKDLVEWVAGNPRELADIPKKHPRLTLLAFNKEKRHIVIVATSHVLKMVSDLIENYFRKRKELIAFEQKVREKEEEVKKQKEEEANAVRDSFRIHPFLTGYLYGKDHKRLENLHNLYRVDVKDGVCEIIGKSPDAVSRAMDELEIAAKKVLLHSNQVGRIFGRQAERIRFLRDHCRGVRIISLDKYPDEFELLRKRMIDSNRQRQTRQKKGNKENESVKLADHVQDADPDSLFVNDGDIINLTGDDEAPEDALIIIGRKSAVEACITMIEMTLQHWQQFLTRRQKLFELRDKIKELKGLPLYRPNKNKRNTGDNENLDDERQEHDGKAWSSPNGRDRRGKNARGERSNRGRGRQQQQQQWDHQEQVTENDQNNQDENIQDENESQQQKGNRKGKGKGKGKGKKKGTSERSDLEKSKDSSRNTTKESQQRGSSQESNDLAHVTDETHKNGGNKRDDAGHQKLNSEEPVPQETSANQDARKKKTRRHKRNKQAVDAEEN